jgi:cell wall-associated NlpC family hydrolase
MTHAEQYSTSEPGACHTPRKRLLFRVVALLALAPTLGITATVISTSGPASADQIATEKAQAADITAKIQATQGQIQTLSNQVEAANYRLSQLNDQIVANQREVAKDQSEVTKDKSQLRGQAIADYTSNGTSSTVTQMFSSNVNSSGIRSEYTAIASGNVTDTIDHLHTAQTQLQATQSALKSQQAQATATRDGLTQAENQADALVQQDQSTLASVNANIQALVKQQEQAAAAAAAASARAAFNAKLAAAQKAQSQAQAAAASASASSAASSSSGSGSGSSSSGSGSGTTVNPVAANPPPVPAGAAGAIQAAESQIGVEYVWGGETPGVGFDCSGLVQWSWAQAGVSLPRTSGSQYAATTHVPLADIQPGDLLFYGPGGSDHVAMYIGGGEMIEAPETGYTVHITGVRTGYGFVGVGRVG